MLKWLRKLTSQKKQPIFGEPGDREAVATVELVTKLLIPQLIYIGLSPYSVPSQGPTASPQARAYVVGLCDCIYRTMPAEWHQVVREAVVIIAVFEMLYGTDRGGELAAQSMAEFNDHGKGEDVLGGFNRAVTDINSWKRGASGGFMSTTPMGFAELSSPGWGAVSESGAKF